jgi:hypothetical protein
LNRKSEQPNRKIPTSKMTKTSHKPPLLVNTSKFLKKHGISQNEIDDIIQGEVSWDITDDSFLLLFDNEGGTKTVCELTPEDVDHLINVSRFENRLSNNSNDSKLFIQGTIEDWAGVSSGTNWRGYVDGYINAAELLSKYGTKDSVEPYLFTCRHAIELLLKSIIMLYQNLKMLPEDLPDHHDLNRLWSSTYPILIQYLKEDEESATEIGRFIKEYHDIDPGSYAFRYPVARKNSKVNHQEYLKAFSMKHHKEHFGNVTSRLNRIIKKIEMQLFFKPFNEMMAKERAKNQAGK